MKKDSSNRRPTIPFPPRGLRRVTAAEYVGISATMFDEWVRDGIMPEPARVGGIVVWDKIAIDDAFDALKAEPVTGDEWEGVDA